MTVSLEQQIEEVERASGVAYLCGWVAYTAGKMKKNRIKTLVGDRVTIEMSPYDLQKGRLIFRHKDESGTSRRPPLRRR